MKAEEQKNALLFSHNQHFASARHKNGQRMNIRSLSVFLLGLCGVDALEYLLVSVAAVVERAVDAAYRGGACAGLADYLAVNLLVAEHLRNNYALRKSLELGHGAEILKKIIALVDILEGENRFEQKINVAVFQLAVHQSYSFSRSYWV